MPRYVRSLHSRWSARRRTVTPGGVQMGHDSAHRRPHQDPALATGGGMQGDGGMQMGGACQMVMGGLPAMQGQNLVGASGCNGVGTGQADMHVGAKMGSTSALGGLPGSSVPYLSSLDAMQGIGSDGGLRSVPASDMGGGGTGMVHLGATGGTGSRYGMMGTGGGGVGGADRMGAGSFAGPQSGMLSGPMSDFNLLMLPDVETYDSAGPPPVSCPHCVGLWVCQLLEGPLRGCEYRGVEPGLRTRGRTRACITLCSSLSTWDVNMPGGCCIDSTRDAIGLFHTRSNLCNHVN